MFDGIIHRIENKQLDSYNTSNRKYNLQFETIATIEEKIFEILMNYIYIELSGITYLRLINMTITQLLKFILSTMITLSAISCQNDNSLNNPVELGRKVHEMLVDQNDLELKKLFLYNADSLSKYDLHDLVFAKKELAYKYDTEIFSVHTQPATLGKNEATLYISYSYNNDTIYRTAFHCRTNMKNELKLAGFTFDNVNHTCQVLRTVERVPEPGDFKFYELNFKTNDNGRRFKSGSVRMRNMTNHDINYIKIKVNIYYKKSPIDKELLFRQDVEAHKHIPSGDIDQIEVPGLKNFWSPYKLYSERLSLQVGIHDVKPNHSTYRWCNLDSLLSVAKEKLE